MADFKATPEQWQNIKAKSVDPMFSIAACVEELRARVEALEADGPAVSNDREPASVAAQPTPAGSLVERVGNAIAAVHVNYPTTKRYQARAAIREVAAWLKEQAPGFLTQDELIEAAYLISKEAE